MKYTELARNVRIKTFPQVILYVVDPLSIRIRKSYNVDLRVKLECVGLEVMALTQRQKSYSPDN